MNSRRVRQGEGITMIRNKTARKRGKIYLCLSFFFIFSLPLLPLCTASNKTQVASAPMLCIFDNMLGTDMYSAATRFQ
eukprot:1520575-Rhodomonas_salina.1